MQANPQPRSSVIADQVRRLARRRARAHLSRLLGKVRPEDAALALPALPPAEQEFVFQILRSDYAESVGEFLTALDPSDRLALLEEMPRERVAGMLGEMAVNDAVAVVEDLPEEMREEVLDSGVRSQLRDHLEYGEDSAGRIMDSDYFALETSTRASSAIEQVRGAPSTDMILYVYVVDSDRRLLGVVSLRQLLLADPDRTLADVMTRSVISASVDTDQEELARLVARYDLLAIPVVGSDGELEGIVSVDDIFDVLQEEADEDMLKMMGSSDNELVYQDRSWQVARIRLPWLLVNLIGLTMAGLLWEAFELSLGERVMLTGFVPVVMGMAGNVGTQASTITVRGLATGRVQSGGGRRRFVWQQLKVGVAIGLVCSLLVAGGAFAMRQNPAYGLVVGLSLMTAVVVASVSGSALPLLFDRLGIDPAVASGPMVTTTNDVTGILVFMGLSSAFIQFLVR